MQPTSTNTPDQHQEALNELIAIGVTLARHLQAQVTAPYPILHDYAAESFERISRAVRRTILLAQRLESTPQQTPNNRDPRSKRDAPTPENPQTPESAQTAESPQHPESTQNPASQSPNPPGSQERPEPQDTPERLDSPDTPDSNDNGNDETADEQAIAKLTTAQAITKIRQDLDPETHPNHNPNIPYDPARPPCRTRPSARNYPPLIRKKGPLYPPIRPRRPTRNRTPPQP